MNLPRGRFGPVALVAAAVLLAAAAPSRAEAPLRAQSTPPELEGVGVTQKLNEQIPLDLSFVDAAGKPVKLGDYFKPGRPVILTMNYFRCPMLCTLILNGLVDALNQIDWSAGKEFELITVSFSHLEGPDLAAVKKRAYLSTYERETAADGWHFLTGTRENIDALAKATGFHFRYDEKTGEFAHPSTIMFLTPEGRMSRYIDDVQFKPRDVRLALVEASKGTIGTPMEKILLFTCFRYDPDANSYAVSAIKLMRLGGAVTLVVLLAGFIVLRRRGHASIPEPAPEQVDPDGPHS